MKKILFLVAFIALLGFVHTAEANEYQCVITSTRAADCEPYYELKHSCPFPQELNETRTEELATNSKPSYPDFCTACGVESKIPKKCQSGRISSYFSTQNSVEVTDDSETSAEPTIDPQKNTILQNAYLGFKLTLKKAWVWLKEILSEEPYQIENPVTPVAGVRG